MQRLKHVQGALGWSLLGLLLTYLLINVIGFASPFWGAWMHPDAPDASRALLETLRPIVAVFSLCFLVAAWHLAMTARSVAARLGIVAMGILVPAAYIGATFARRALAASDAPIPPQEWAVIELACSVYLGFAALVFLALAWRALRNIHHH